MKGSNASVATAPLFTTSPLRRWRMRAFRYNRV